LCTNKQEAATRRLLADLDMTRLFDFIAGVDTFPVHKPHAGHVLGVMHAMKVTAPGCVMVGDSMNDVLAAHGAGIPCIVVTHGYASDYDQLGADILIGGFGELSKSLLQILGR
jgi:phosphoglycolate phosphatase